ncbi:FMN-binding protein [Paraliobacillus salinarum]|uniref:FMN-binding protein n=1 Tax=Paraliobacillus salinarum TaxID=1158996 RepID=UPI0015F4DF3B|nr:FMN-binding protein [Paraliobacillus salinarum]
MNLTKSRLASLFSIMLLVALLAACSGEDEEATAGEEQTDLEWSIQPELGITKGDYYYAEERFRQGHLGQLEVVTNNGEIAHVEFNEQTRPNYYHRYFQDVPKRMSEYNFSMGEKKGAAWIQSVVKVEQQMEDEQRITGEFDVVSGASNSINQAMVPLAEKIEPTLDQPSDQKYYSIAEELDGGLTGLLKVVVSDKKIISVSYDEIFADSPNEIEDPALKRFYRQSKYQSVEYHEPSRIGFNVQMDALNESVVEKQDLLDLSDLPAIGESGDYAASGYTTRNTAWDNYLRLAEELLAEMQNDGVL